MYCRFNFVFKRFCLLYTVYCSEFWKHFHPPLRLVRTLITSNILNLIYPQLPRQRFFWRMQEGVPEETRRFSNELCSVWKDSRFEEERICNSINLGDEKKLNWGFAVNVHVTGFTPNRLPLRLNLLITIPIRSHILYMYIMYVV